MRFCTTRPLRFETATCGRLSQLRYIPFLSPAVCAALGVRESFFLKTRRSPWFMVVPTCSLDWKCPHFTCTDPRVVVPSDIFFPYKLLYFSPAPRSLPEACMPSFYDRFSRDPACKVVLFFLLAWPVQSIKKFFVIFRCPVFFSHPDPPVHPHPPPHHAPLIPTDTQLPHTGKFYRESSPWRPPS